MSAKEKAISYINEMTETQAAALVLFLDSFGDALRDSFETVPDAFDLAMIENAKKENDGKTVNIESLADDLGVIL